MPPPPPNLLDHVHALLRVKHSSRRTEASSIHWITHSIRFPGTRHPADLDATHRAALLPYVAVEQQVAALMRNHVPPALVVRARVELGIAVWGTMHAVRAGAQVMLQVCGQSKP
jgi:hypothetical protein